MATDSSPNSISTAGANGSNSGLAPPASTGTDKTDINLDEPLPCPECGYDLRATHADLCNECGAAVDRSTLRVSSIPWTHRRTIGRFRAYIKTVWLFTIGSKKLAFEITKAQDLDAAVRFRRL